MSRGNLFFENVTKVTALSFFYGVLNNNLQSGKNDIWRNVGRTGNTLGGRLKSSDLCY